MSQAFDYEQFEREAADRPGTIARVKSLLKAADEVRSRSLEAAYRKGAKQLIARHSITESELTEGGAS